MIIKTAAGIKKTFLPELKCYKDKNDNSDMPILKGPPIMNVNFPCSTLG